MSDALVVSVDRLRPSEWAVWLYVSEGRHGGRRAKCAAHAAAAGVSERSYRSAIVTLRGLGLVRGPSVLPVVNDRRQAAANRGKGRQKARV